jgi:membrane protein implicated in regulation of membrane protease activity
MRFELAIIARELIWVAMISAGLVLIAMIANLIAGAAGTFSLAVATLATIVLVMAVALGARSLGQPERKKLNTVETLGPVDE